MTSGFKKIIWAVDAFQDDLEIETRCLEAMRVLTRGSEPKIEPVYVTPLQQVGAPLEGAYPAFEYYGHEAEGALKHRFEKITSPRLSTPKVIDAPVMSTAGVVKTLSVYAGEAEAELIVAGTHSRKGLSRFFLGSFAESLLLHSRTPLLLVSAHAAPIKTIESVFFPTDFGELPETIFPRVLELVQFLNAKLYIYHLMQLPFVLPTSMIRPPEVAELLAAETRASEELLEDYRRKAEAAGIDVETILDDSMASEADAIVETATRKRAGLIAMAAQSGVGFSILPGSTTRQAVRSSPCPIWVLNSQLAVAETQTPSKIQAA